MATRRSPLPYPDPDVIALDDRFRPYILFTKTGPGGRPGAPRSAG